VVLTRYIRKIKPNAYAITVVKREGKRPHGRHGVRWNDNFKTDLKEIESV
jgi:hypothetical protein